MPGHRGRLQFGPAPRRLGARRRLDHVGLPWRPADGGRPGRRHRRTARLPAEPGSPQRLGEHGGPDSARASTPAPPTRSTAGSSGTNPASRRARCTTGPCAWSRTACRRPSPAELLAGPLAGQTHLHSLGITSFQDACVGAAGELGMPDSFDTYLMAADYGMLSCHVVGALWWDRHRGLGQIDDLLARREQASDGQFRATTVKLMLDGVCETFTAAMSVAVPGPARASHRPPGHACSSSRRCCGKPPSGWPRRDSSCTSTPSAITPSAPRST